MTETDVLRPLEVHLPVKPLAKFEREKAAFRRLLPQLLNEYRDKFVAIHQEQVVGSGDDILNVAHAAYVKFGYQPIYVDLVTDLPQRPARIPGVRISSNE